MDPLLRGLKIFVVISGIVLVLGTTALIWLIAQRRDEPPTPVRPPGAVADLALPAGARIVEMRLDGRTALLRLRGEDEQEYLALVDVATGERRSLLRLVPGVP